MQTHKLSVGSLRVGLIVLTMLVAQAIAQNEIVLNNFDGPGQVSPIGGLLFDATGNLFGTTASGGVFGGGAVFELTPIANGHWKDISVSSITYPQGAVPCTSLVFDAAGSLYGMTQQGVGASSGSAFKLTKTAGGGWTGEAIHTFGLNRKDGYWPCGNLIFDAGGNLYGTTSQGGTYAVGIVFELTPSPSGPWTEKILHSFGNGTDGWYPGSGLIFDASGNLYGTAGGGGAYGGGTVFELTPTTNGSWREKALHSFNYNGKDGVGPAAGVISDLAGNLYGTTVEGGTYGLGTVFMLSPQPNGRWKEKVLHDFNYDGVDGFNPSAGLVIDSVGNLYGTTPYGGNGTNCAYANCGIAFELSQDTGGNWSERILHDFSASGIDGYNPLAGLILDSRGNLYGTTFLGGLYSSGTVFEITP